jgi:hypothetical protein
MECIGHFISRNYFRKVTLKRFSLENEASTQPWTFVFILGASFRLDHFVRAHWVVQSQLSQSRPLHPDS